MPLIETNLWRSTLTMFVFLGVVIYVFTQLSNVFVNSIITTNKITQLQAEKKVIYANIDRELQVLQQIKEEKKNL